MNFVVEINQLSKLSFLDYFRILNQSQKDHQTAYQVIHQHDKDKVTYQDNYDVIHGVIDDVVKQISDEMVGNDALIMNELSVLISLLAQKGILSKADIDKLVKLTSEITAKGRKK